MDHLLHVNHLSVAQETDIRPFPIVTDISFSIDRREIVVLLGESGSGKTMMSRALTGLFPAGANLSWSGDIRFAGRRIDLHNEGEVLLLRREGIRYIFQDPIAALNPVATIRSQLNNACNRKEDSEDEMIAILNTVGIRNSSDVLNAYPHQISVGMAQRVTIALAIQSGPLLLVADEPTSALDASLRYRLLDLLVSLRELRGMSILLITHDLRIAQRYGTRVIVMYKGHIIESADRKPFFDRPLHPYCQSLLDALPAPELRKRNQPVASPSLSASTLTTHGCRFAHECRLADDRCATIEPVLEAPSAGREIRCHYWK